VVDRVGRHPGRQVGHQRHPEHLGAGRAGGDRLVHGRHPDQIGAQGAQHPDLGRGLIVRARHRRVDAVVQRFVDGAGDIAGYLAGDLDEQRGRIVRGRGHFTPPAV